MASKKERRPTENALRDMTEVPVNLLYDEGNDLTVMQRGTATGDGNVQVSGGTLDEVTNVSSVDTVDEVTNVTSVDTVDEVTQSNIHAWRSSDSSWIGPRIDPSSTSFQVIDYAHHEIHSGSHYFNEFATDVPALDWIDIRWTTPNTAAECHILISVRTQEEGLYQLYEDAPILNAGTTIPIFNNNRNSGNTSGVTGVDYIINTTEANANLDTDISGATKLRQALLGSNQGNVSGEIRSDNELVLIPDTAYLLRVNNQVSSTRYISWVLDWYEHTPHA